MLLINQYKDILLEEFYLDNQDIIRRKKDGYRNRFKAGDKATLFKMNSQGYLAIHIPKTRSSLPASHLFCLLRGIDIPEGMCTDHKDGNVLNNFEDNIRIITQGINNKNRAKRSDNTSGITGIRWSDYHKHFVIRRTVNGKRLSRNRKTLAKAILVLDELKLLDSEYTERHGK